ncbi:MAG: phytanoyl-CoA dioxygenase family protein [Ilumatobacter sp.]|uniref:phytanoyl-CoA dioxygenase family protein n=1 Tax=Ilumatobacter sp. TaxID=1967498 RepID=UPI0026143AFA|nr:phytanoyl-CoA dioxygenase family protein [Ilumatobacter sp.]MDJ0769698.1 phytanoyl-CoA dioxygenase family protein [Ilumatobacter sp.]
MSAAHLSRDRVDTEAFARAVTTTARSERAAAPSSYEQAGYAVHRGVLDTELVARADRHVDWLLASNPELRPDQLGHRLARTDPFWYELVADDRLLDVAEEYIGPDIALFATHYICKEPRTGRRVPWHHDAGFWPLDPMDVVTLWLAITESTPDNGCLGVVPGSHRSPPVELVESGRDEVLGREVPVDVDPSTVVLLTMAPGDVSVHHPAIIHGSEPNRSDRWRRGLTIRYIPTTTRILDDDAAAPFLLRGTGDERNTYLPVPSPDRDQAEHLGHDPCEGGIG